MTQFLEEALKYANWGKSVIPWKYTEGSKRPTVKWKELQERHWSPNEINDWWQTNPHHNVGVVTGEISDLVVLDADDDAAVNWIQENIPATSWVVITGRGMQFGFRHPGTTVRNRAKIDGMNLDLRGDGGYVAMPPSRHKTGAQYAWAPARKAPQEDMPVFDEGWLPEQQTPEVSFLPTGQVEKNSAYKRAQKWMAKRDPAVEGSGGDHHTYITACNLVRDFGLPLHSALELMLDWNKSCQPPWSMQDLTAKLQSALRSGKAPIGSKPSQQKTRPNADLSEWTQHYNTKISTDYPENDYGNAQRFALRFKHIIRYCYDESAWFVWNGKQWRADDSGAAMRLAKTIPEFIHKEAHKLDGSDEQKHRHRHASRTGAANKLSAMLALSASEPDIPALVDDFDQEPMVINTPSGIVNLENGKLEKHQPDRMLNQMTDSEYDKDAKCPTWERFVSEIFKGNKDLMRYMQQLAGYSLTGSINEHIFIYCYGGGRNGKSTFINTLIKIFGDYAASAPPNLLISKRNDPHPTELAFLRKIRLALGGEVKPGERLDEGKLKHLTGGEKITARTMRKDFTQFTPTHTLWLAGNMKLKIYATDIGMWERIKLIPFQATFTGNQRDVTLPERLLEEAPGILAWAVRGAIDWHKSGFTEPDIVTKATLQYKQDENLFAQWLTEKTEKEAHGTTPHKELRQDYVNWCDDNSIKHPHSTRAFTNAMREAGFERSKGGTRNWRGISLKRY
jgi:putative DNA primase/helicase